MTDREQIEQPVEENAPQDDIVIVDDDAQDIPVEQNERPEPEKPKKAGYDRIDFATAKPEEIQARFDRVYGQVKAQDKKMQQYARDMQLAAAHIQQLNEAVNALNGQNSMSQYENAEATLVARLKEASERGDDNAQALLFKQLADLTAEKKLKEVMIQAQKNQPRQPQNPANAQAYANQAYQNGELDVGERDYVVSWQSETDESGQPLRPWAFSTDPRHHRALGYAKQIFADPEFQSYTIEEKMAELDRLMNAKPQQQQRPTAAARATIPQAMRQQSSPNGNVVRLTEQEKRVAIMLKSGGVNAKSDSDHIKAYAMQKSAIEKANKRRA